MNRLLVVGLLAGCLAGTVGAGSTLAQVGTGQCSVFVPQCGVSPWPLLNPYLNGVSPAPGQAPAAAMSQDEIAERAAPPLSTGHLSFFNATGGYFNNNRVSIGPSYRTPNQRPCVQIQVQQFPR